MGLAKQGVRYINDVDRAAVGEFLASRASITRPLRVQFYPQADALFFADIENEDLRFLQPTFHDNARPDLHIVHVSRYSTRLVDRIRRLQLRDYGLPAAPGAGWSLLHERDQTETWLFRSSPAR